MLHSYFHLFSWFPSPETKKSRENIRINPIGDGRRQSRVWSIGESRGGNTDDLGNFFDGRTRMDSICIHVEWEYIHIGESIYLFFFPFDPMIYTRSNFFPLLSSRCARPGSAIRSVHASNYSQVACQVERREFSFSFEWVDEEREK
jgi:hypothetical protein